MSAVSGAGRPGPGLLFFSGVFVPFMMDQHLRENHEDSQVSF
jgi:hypothetical protein